MTFDEAVARIHAARTPRDLFPVDDADDMQRRFHELSRACHPDLVPVEHRDTATAIMSDLTCMYVELTKPSTRPATPPLVGKWLVTANLAKGALNDLYAVRNVKGTDDDTGVLKIARHPRDNGLLKREVDALRLLAKDDRGDRFQRYIPKVLDTFEASYRRANVLSYDHKVVSLETLRRLHAHAGGVPFRHVVWMMNRLLSVLGFAHRNGVIHGAVLPHHLMYRPDDHGLQLIDWVGSCWTTYHRVPYAVTKYKDLYPVEVLFAKGTAYPATDIYMAFATMRWAADQIPYRFRALFDWCLVESYKTRPSDPWAVQDRWIKLAEEEFGKPKFVPLEVAVN